MPEICTRKKVVHLTLFVVTIERMGTMRNHMPFFLIALNILKHTCSDRKCPIFLENRAIQELMVKEGLCLIDMRRKFVDCKPKPRNQSYTSVL
jgi:hypothetical protein